MVNSALAKGFCTPNKLTELLNKTSVLFGKLTAELDYQVNRLKHARTLPSLSQADRAIVETLNREGVCITSLEELAIPSTSRILEAASEILPHLPKTPHATHERDAGSHAVHASPNKITKNCPELFHWGLQERLLDIAENYLGLPPAYLGVNLRKDVPNGKQTGTRLWHKDGEDRRVLKVMIYLNDVGEDGGPFEYIPPHLSPSYHPFQHIYCKILDGDMQQVVPASNWKACTGSAGTVVIVDTAKVFHHGKIPQSERAALFFCYTSRQPKRLDICHTHYSRARAMEIAQTLPQRQKECVLWEK